MSSDGRGRFTPVLSGLEYVRALSFDSALLPYLNDAISDLAIRSTWLEVGDSVEDTVAAVFEALDVWFSNMLVGMVSPFVCEPPAGWLALDGSTYALADYPFLAAVIPAAWVSGSDFTLPDCQDVFLVGENTVSSLGGSEGSNNLTLALGQLPPHTHNYTVPTSSPVPAEPGPPVPSSIVGGSVPTSSVGSGDSIDIRPARFKVVFAIFTGQV